MHHISESGDGVALEGPSDDKLICDDEWSTGNAAVRNPILQLFLAICFSQICTENPFFYKEDNLKAVSIMS